MKEFHNIVEAINYHQKCFICGSTLWANFHDEPIKIIEETWHRLFGPRKEIGGTIRVNLSSQVDSETDDWLTINVLTNSIALESLRRHNPDYSYTIGTDDPLRFHHKGPSTTGYSYNGTLYYPINVNCPKCHQFSYTIQMILDIVKENRITHLYLNSEFISWSDDKHVTHEIKNIYTTEQTEYAHFSSHNYPKINSDRMSLPLIPLNLHNPSETLGRIKKLIIFS
jgi:hypothetical protein